MSNLVSSKLVLNLADIKVADVAVGRVTVAIEFSAPAEFVAARQDRMLEVFQPLIDRFHSEVANNLNS